MNFLNQITEAANRGDPEAQYQLALFYYKGNILAKDLSKAVELYEKAAQQGSAKAQYNLAVCYEQGLGVSKNQ